jgi:hypothetical protein
MVMKKIFFKRIYRSTTSFLKYSRYRITLTYQDLYGFDYLETPNMRNASGFVMYLDLKHKLAQLKYFKEIAQENFNFIER